MMAAWTGMGHVMPWSWTRDLGTWRGTWQDSVAFTQNQINRVNLRAAIAELRADEPGLVRLLARAVAADRCE